MVVKIVEGKFNKAKVFTDNIDETTLSQINDLCDEEIFKDSKIRIMPDCHAGAGCVIGTTMTIADKIVPNLVGVDIGCGVTTIQIDSENWDGWDLEEESTLVELDNIIRKEIPSGFNVHEISRKASLDYFKLDLMDLKCVEHVNIDRAYKSVGTLGGGNHFIEINKSQDNRYYLTVHSGSRNLGNQIAQYYQNKAVEYCKNKFQEIYKKTEAKIIKDCKNNNCDELIGEKLNEYRQLRQKPPVKDLCYLEGILMKDYLHDMGIAQRYAQINRITILADILYSNADEDFRHYPISLKIVLDSHIESIHNYIDLENMILRKGAISANLGEHLMIPLNMKEGLIIGVGVGNPDWNYSAPHGAGRIMGRKQAKNKLSLNEFKDSMKDVYTTSVSEKTLDEAPMAYKPINDILDYIGDSVSVWDVMKPIYNFKSEEQ